MINLLDMPRSRALEFENLTNAEPRQQKSQPARQDDGGHQAPAILAKRLLNAHPSCVELRFIEAADLVGNAENRGAARKDFIAQKRVAGSLPLGRRPLERGLEHVPI